MNFYEKVNVIGTLFQILVAGLLKLSAKQKLLAFFGVKKVLSDCLA